MPNHHGSSRPINARSSLYIYSTFQFQLSATFPTNMQCCCVDVAGPNAAVVYIRGSRSIAQTQDFRLDSPKTLPLFLSLLIALRWCCRSIMDAAFSSLANRTVDDIWDLSIASPDAVSQRLPTAGPIAPLPPPAVPARPAPPPSESPNRPKQSQRPTADPEQATRVVPESIDGYAANFSFLMGGPPPRAPENPPSQPSATATENLQRSQHYEISSREEGYDLNNVGDSLNNFIEHTHGKFDLMFSETERVFDDVHADIKHHKVQIRELQEYCRQKEIDATIFLKQQQATERRLHELEAKMDAEKH